MEKNKDLIRICLVGRPNVGKSSLFNCLLGEKRSVTLEESGTTRDRVESVMKIGRFAVTLVDTGGFQAGDKDSISSQVRSQILGSISQADIVIFVVDSIDGITGGDSEVAELLRRSGKEVRLVANKADNDGLAMSASEFYELGFGDPAAVSCVHRRGIRKLKNQILEEVKRSGSGGSYSEENALKIAVVGRPNVGKSSFVNSLLLREHAIVSDIPGTTRDSTDTFFSFEGDTYVLIDTAGLRHKRKIRSVVDTFSMMRSKEAIKRSDIAILMLDACDGLTKDDLGILDQIEETGKGCLVVVNKWDLAEKVEGVSREEYTRSLVYASGRMRKFPLVFVSAATGQNVTSCLPLVKSLNSNLDVKASTPFLNRIFEREDPSRVPVPRKEKRPNFLYVVQSGTRPVEFKYFVSDPSAVRPSHESFIENRLRDHLPLSGIPVKLVFVRSVKERVRQSGKNKTP